MNAWRLPAIALTPTSERGSSRIGGLPSLPDDVTWPHWKGEPLAFLCQLNLAEIPQDCNRQGLPASGMLYFFYCQEQETWGFDPKDEGSWQVIYSATPSATPRAAPRGLKVTYPEKVVSFGAVQTYPDWQDDRVDALNLSDHQMDLYMDMCSGVFAESPAHHLFGYPSPVQGNYMDLQCQLASNGLYLGGPEGYESPQAKALEAGRSDWILLLQWDTDDDVEMMWGDAGMLYFWIRKQDLASGRFDKCWMVLQCA